MIVNELDVAKMMNVNAEGGEILEVLNEEPRGLKWMQVVMKSLVVVVVIVIQIGLCDEQIMMRERKKL